MKVLKEISLDEIKKKAETIDLLHQQLHQMKIELQELLAESASNYYGTECSSANEALHKYFRNNPINCETEDGYKIISDNYAVRIEKQLDDVTIVGTTNRYDKPISHLDISIYHKKSNREYRLNHTSQMPKKYMYIAVRMLQIEKEFRIFNPYKEFNELRYL